MSAPPDVLIVSARGSTEPQSGSRLLSPLARGIMREYAGESRFLELTYPASFVTFTSTYPATVDLGDSPHIGVSNLVDLLNTEAGRHPEQILILLGWSQGALVITDALLPADLRGAGRTAGELDQVVLDQITAIALFGNPTFTAGEPFNAGDPRPGVSGVAARPIGVLARHAGHLRDYCARDDLAAQVVPTASIEGHTAYFHNNMRAEAQHFILQRVRGRAAE